MNIKQLVKKLLKISSDITNIEKALVYSFANKNAINTNNSQWLKRYLSNVNFDVIDKVNQVIVNNLSLSELIALFEMLVPQIEKKEKGVVYTPKEITEYIVRNTLNFDYIPTVLDPSCGCGAFLVTAAEYIHEKHNISYSEIISSYLYGVDIDSNAIDRIKSLLSLVVLMNDEVEKCSFNIICADTLDKETYDMLNKMYRNGFDCVLGNPPYVRNKNMSENTKRHLSNWVSSSVGNVDLYIPFFEIGIKLLSDNGKLGYISPNSYFQGVNGRSLRKYFSSIKHQIEIIDFRDNQVFENVTSYTCITLIDKAIITDTIKYFRLNETSKLEQPTFSAYHYSEFPDGKPWRMRESSIDEVIQKLESTGTPLSKWKIRNGLATLKNDLYFFSPIKEDADYYYREYKDKTYRIEKNVCIKVAKPNIIKSEEELKQKMEMAIFPYTHTDNTYQLIKEESFKSSFPEAYKFLTEYKSLLLNRDKGHGNYPAWYAYGRTQGMNNFGKKLLIPYISGNPVAVLSLDPDVLFYCGYALLSEDIEELKMLKIFLESEAFWYYIFHTSKPYSKGYMAFAKNYIVNFTIPNLSEEEKAYLLGSNNRKELDDFIWKKYRIYQ
ncbi:N-6 DNA methylase [Ruminococcus sp.]|uniref:HsdM family class I SAM-dependent methyltransferase n=1 Tax=Ruminococcus sp. TaxID=41978 RepID=UPI0025D6F6BE|nr:N-6 DNA methylase [Ruminococcus sp.]